MMRQVLPGGLTSVHHQNVAGDEVGSVGSEKDGGSFQIMFTAETALRNLGQEEFAVVFQHPARHVSRKPAGSNRIHLDVVRCPFARKILGETDHSALARVIPNGWECGRSATQSSYRGDIDDLSATLL